jgi:hypothetical protein
MRKSADKASIVVQRVGETISGQVLRTRSCPRSLAELIRIVNFIPPEIELPDINELLSDGAFSADDSDQSVGKTLAEAWRRFLRRHFPSEQFAQLYHYLGPIHAHRLAEICDRYVLIADAQNLLTAIANAQGRKIDVPPQAMEGISVLAIDDSGNVRLEPGRLLRIVNGVEAKRIRQCSECKRIFWAGRIDKPACSKKCLQRRRARRWRERYPEAYKVQRYKSAGDREPIPGSNLTTRRKAK